MNKEMKILVLDNYDSFTYNLVQYIERIEGVEVSVRRNDKIKIEDIDQFDKILISPGPGVPDEAGITKELIAHYGASKSILGVCLGHQAIAEVFGGSIRNLDTVYHGVAGEMIREIEDDNLFKGIPSKFEAGRYHSWIVNEKMPDCLEVTVRNSIGEVMALRHKEYNVRGVQFHPESVLTEFGELMIKNWVLEEV